MRQHRNWYRALLRSHTGKRLNEMLPEGARIYMTNASPVIGDDPSACFDADLPHLQKVLDDFQPDKILACGKVAQGAMDDLGQSYVAAPHPAWRFLSKKMTADIKQQLSQ